MRKGVDSLSAHVQTALSEDPFGDQIFIFRGRRADRLKILWHQAQGLCLYYRRLDSGSFVWPHTSGGTVLLGVAQLSLLLEGSIGLELTAAQAWRGIRHRQLLHDTVAGSGSNTPFGVEIVCGGTRAHYTCMS